MLLLAAAYFPETPFVLHAAALAVAGDVCFLLGALLLFDPPVPTYEVSLSVALAIAATIGAFMVFAMAKVVQVRRKPVEVGVHSLVGSHGYVRGSGFVFVHGELWRAEPVGGTTLEPGQRVEVAGVDGLTLRVRPVRETGRVT